MEWYKATNRRLKNQFSRYVKNNAVFENGGEGQKLPSR
jgi:hypothetical protein